MPVAPDLLRGGLWPSVGSRLRLAAGLVNERPTTPRLRRQGIAAEPVAQATRAEPASPGFGDVLGAGAAVVAVILARFMLRVALKEQRREVERGAFQALPVFHSLAPGGSPFHYRWTHDRL